MDFNRAYLMKNEQRNPAWRVIDAQGKILGRLATQVAEALRGKDLAKYTPHTDSGDYVVVINADKIKLSANKMETKMYWSYSGWIGGYKERSARQIFDKNPAELIERAVKGMLPKNRLSDKVLTKLKVYVGTEHPHKAQFEGQAQRAARAAAPKVEKVAQPRKAPVKKAAKAE
jgi:large subunit ribosomal protein L13